MQGLSGAMAQRHRVKKGTAAQRQERLSGSKALWYSGKNNSAVQWRRGKGRLNGTEGQWHNGKGDYASLITPFLPV